MSRTTDLTRQYNSEEGCHRAMARRGMAHLHYLPELQDTGRYVIKILVEEHDIDAIMAKGWVPVLESDVDEELASMDTRSEAEIASAEIFHQMTPGLNDD